MENAACETVLWYLSSSTADICDYIQQKLHTFFVLKVAVKQLLPPHNMKPYNQ